MGGFDTDTLGRNYRWDTCHFNSYGREAIVERVAPDLVRHLRDEKTNLSADARAATDP